MAEIDGNLTLVLFGYPMDSDIIKPLYFNYQCFGGDILHLVCSMLLGARKHKYDNIM